MSKTYSLLSYNYSFCTSSPGSFSCYVVWWFACPEDISGPREIHLPRIYFLAGLNPSSSSSNNEALNIKQPIIHGSHPLSPRFPHSVESAGRHKAWSWSYNHGMCYALGRELSTTTLQTSAFQIPKTRWEGSVTVSLVIKCSHKKMIWSFFVPCPKKQYVAMSLK